MADKIRIYKKSSSDGKFIFWTAKMEGGRGEKLLNTKVVSLPVKEGFYGKEYISPYNANYIKRELKAKGYIKRMRSIS